MNWKKLLISIALDNVLGKIRFKLKLRKKKHYKKLKNKRY